MPCLTSAYWLRSKWDNSTAWNKARNEHSLSGMWSNFNILSIYCAFMLVHADDW